MFHARKIFREKIVQYLGAITQIKKVYVNEPIYLEYKDCPVVYVTSDGENINTNNVGSPRVTNRTLNFSLSVYVKTQVDLADKVDELCYEIENAFSLSKERVKFDNMALSSQLTSVDFSFDETQDRDVVKFIYNLEILYNLKETKLNMI